MLHYKWGWFVKQKGTQIAMGHGHIQKHIHRVCDFAQFNHKKWIQLQLVIAFMWCWICCLILGGGCFLKIIMKESLVLRINYPLQYKKRSLWTICGLERATVHIEINSLFNRTFKRTLLSNMVFVNWWNF
jgi:hypothetical protein